MSRPRQKKTKGYILIDRALDENWVWEDYPFNNGCAWVDMLMLATYREMNKVESKGKTFTLDRGDICVSSKEMAGRWGWSRQGVRTFISKLEATGMVTIKRGTTNIISIVNYDEYQGKLKAYKEKPEKDGKKAEKIKADVEEILAFINEITGREGSSRFKTAKGLSSRLYESNSVEEIKVILKMKYAEWKGGVMEKFFKPETLFRKSNFDKYKLEALRKLEEIKKDKIFKEGCAVLAGDLEGLDEGMLIRGEWSSGNIGIYKVVDIQRTMKILGTGFTYLGGKA